MVKFFQTILKLYQWSVSPDHGLFRARYPYGFCRFYPSCSQYAYEALDKHGVVKGFYLTGLRLLRCNPWAQPHIDHIPQL